MSKYLLFKPILVVLFWSYTILTFKHKIWLRLICKNWMWQHSSRTKCDIYELLNSQLRRSLVFFWCMNFVTPATKLKSFAPFPYCHTLYLVLLSMYLLCNVILNLFIAFVVTKKRKWQILKRKNSLELQRFTCKLMVS